MTEYPQIVDEIDNTSFRRGMIVAVVYAVVDALVLLTGGGFIIFRLIGVLAAYYASKDVVLLREAGLEWGKTRFLVIVFVGIGGFLGFFFYAYRRAIHVSNQKENLKGVDEAGDEPVSETEPTPQDETETEPILKDETEDEPILQDEAVFEDGNGLKSE